MKEKTFIVNGDVIKLMYNEEDSKQIENNWTAIGMKLMEIGAKVYEEEKRKAEVILNNANKVAKCAINKANTILNETSILLYDEFGEMLNRVYEWFDNNKDLIFNDEKLPIPIYNNNVNNILRRDIRYRNKNIRLNLLHYVRM